MLNENKKEMVFEKGDDVRSIESFQFDSSQHQLQDITLGEGQLRKGYEVRLGYYR
jgi:hypothetical protein